MYAEQVVECGVGRPHTSTLASYQESWQHERISLPLTIITFLLLFSISSNVTYFFAMYGRSPFQFLMPEDMSGLLKIFAFNLGHEGRDKKVSVYVEERESTRAQSLLKPSAQNLKILITRIFYVQNQIWNMKLISRHVFIHVKGTKRLTWNNFSESNGGGSQLSQSQKCFLDWSSRDCDK